MKLLTPTLIVVLVISTPIFGLDRMCRNKTYVAEIDKFATQGELQIPLTVQLTLAPAGTIFDGDTWDDRYVIEYTPDPNIQQATFKFLITFDPNMCVEPPTVIEEWTYPVRDTIPAPEIPIRPFVEKGSS